MAITTSFNCGSSQNTGFSYGCNASGGTNVSGGANKSSGQSASSGYSYTQYPNMNACNYNAILQGYGNLSSNVLGTIQGVDQAQLNAVQCTYTKQNAMSQQQAINSGLGNSTVLSSLQAGNVQQEALAQTSVTDQYAQLLAGYMSNLGLAQLGFQAQNYFTPNQISENQSASLQSSAGGQSSSGQQAAKGQQGSGQQGTSNQQGGSYGSCGRGLGGGGGGYGCGCSTPFESSPAVGYGGGDYGGGDYGGNYGGGDYGGGCYGGC